MIALSNAFQNFFRIRLLIAIFGCIIFSNDYYAIAQTSEVNEESAKLWSKKIIAILPDSSVIIPETQLDAASLTGQSLTQLRQAVDDASSYRISTDTQALLSLYKNQSQAANSSRDIKIAQLYTLINSEDSIIESEQVKKLIRDEDWFVAHSATYRTAVAHLYSGSYEKTMATLNQASLLLSSDINDPLYDEARYNTAGLTYTMSTYYGNLQQAYDASQLVNLLGKKHNRRIDYHTNVLNLAQLHTRKYTLPSSADITGALVEYSRRISKTKTTLALTVHGKTLTEIGEFDSAIRALIEGLTLGPDPYWKSELTLQLTYTYADDGKTELAQETLDNLIADKTASNASFPAEHWINIAKYKIARNKGDMKSVENLHDNITDFYRDLLDKNRLLLSRSIRTLPIDSQITYERRTKQRKATLLDLAGFQVRHEQNVNSKQIFALIDQKQLGDLYNLLKYQPPKIALYDKSIHSLRNKFMDALFERRSDLLPADVLSEFRQSITQQSSLSDQALLQVFEEAVRRIDRDRLPNNETDSEKQNAYPIIKTPSNSISTTKMMETSAYAHIIDGTINTKNGHFAAAWHSLAQAQKIVSENTDISQNIYYEISDLELTLYAMEGDYSQALSSAVTYVIAVTNADRMMDGVSPINNTIIALERGGFIKQALALSDRFISYTNFESGNSNYFALYTKGRLLNKDKQYDAAILFLEKALKTVIEPEKEALVLRQLYLAYAGVGQKQKAQRVRNNLMTALSIVNAVALTDTSAPILANGDYLLSKYKNSASTTEMYQKWASLQLAHMNTQRQNMLQLAKYRFEAKRAVFSSLNSDFIEKTDQQAEIISNHKTSQWALLALVIAITTLLAILYLKFNSVRRIKAKNAHASRVKGQFLNLIGHETRTSLQGIDSFVQSLKASSVSMEHLPTVQIIGSQANALSRTITDLIFSARMIAGDRPPQSDLFDTLNYRSQMLPIWISLLGKRDVAVNFLIDPTLPLFLTDKLFLETAISYIVRDCIEKTRVGSIDIEFNHEKSLRGSMLSVAIEDTGSGIPDTELDSMFDFFEVDENGVSKSGHSNALSFPIAKNAVKALGGTLVVTSRPGQGTRVNFSIPITRAAANDIDNDHE